MLEATRTLESPSVPHEIPCVTDKEKTFALRAGKKWKKETGDIVQSGLQVWSRVIELKEIDSQKLSIEERAKFYGKAIAALDNGKVRDCLLMRSLEGRLDFHDAISRDEIEQSFLRLEDSVPDMRAIKTLAHTLTICCGYASDVQGYPFALVAYLSWWTANFQSAREYVGLAIERDASNSLACLLSRVLDESVVPPWMFH